MVSIAMSKMGIPYDRVDVCQPWNESQRPVLPRCLTLSADAANDQACCRLYVCLSTRQRSISYLIMPRTPLNCYRKKYRTSLVLIFIHQTAQTWIQWILYKVWGVMLQRVYKCHMNSVDELKQRLVEVWNSLQQNVIHVAINEWRKRLRTCLHVDGRHFEHFCGARVTDNSYGQIKYK